MNIVLNGQSKTLPGPLSVSALVDQLGYSGKRIAVERNGEIVPKSTYPNVQLEAGDRLEELRAMRRRIAVSLDDVTTPARDLAALSRRQIELGKEIDALEARAKEEVERGSVSDGAFDAKAI